MFIFILFIGMLASYQLDGARFDEGFAVVLHPAIESKVRHSDRVSEIFQIKSVLPFYSEKFDYLDVSLSIIQSEGGLWHGGLLVRKLKNESWEDAQVIEAIETLDTSMIEYLDDDEILSMIGSTHDQRIHDLKKKWAIISSGNSDDALLKKIYLLSRYRKGMDLSLDKFYEEIDIRKINRRGGRPLDITQLILPRQ